MKITILYEDANVLVLNKPAGISVHGDGKAKGSKTVADFILKNYPKLKNVGEPFEGDNGAKIPRPGIVHRIDKETSGVLVVAKNQKTFNFIKKQFQKHKVVKTYWALVYGFVPKTQNSLASGLRARITAPIGRSPNDIRMWTAGRGARGSGEDGEARESVTEYNTLARFTDTKNKTLAKSPSHQFSLVEVYPKTGRTHQIRVHMRYINHPIVSDPLYRGSHKQALGMKRLALHAKSIRLEVAHGKSIEVESLLPADFKKVVKDYKLQDWFLC